MCIQSIRARVFSNPTIWVKPEKEAKDWEVSWGGVGLQVGRTRKQLQQRLAATEWPSMVFKGNFQDGHASQINVGKYDNTFQSQVQTLFIVFYNPCPCSQAFMQITEKWQHNTFLSLTLHFLKAVELWYQRQTPHVTKDNCSSRVIQGSPDGCALSVPFPKLNGINTRAPTGIEWLQMAFCSHTSFS